jgi:CMP/dCMP kinase
LEPKIIAIDGPVAVGKSSVGKLLAKKLGYIFFDTGMMYRAFTSKVLKLHISSEDETKLCQLAATTKFDFVPSDNELAYILIDGHDVSSELLHPEIERRVYAISKVAGVRQVIVSEQRRIARRGKIIMAGRDIGTVVLPWADLKVFLVASAEERANRRCKELLEQGGKVNYETILTELKKRDESDIHRTISPLTPAAGAIIINTEKLSLHQVVNKIHTLIINLDIPSSPAVQDDPEQ